MSNILFYRINKANCEKFLAEYPELGKLMSQKWKGKNLLKQYCSFLKFKDSIPTAEFAKQYKISFENVSAPTFGSKDFFRINWYETQGWGEIFQYLRTT